MKKSKTLYYEKVEERFCGHVISSTVTPATKKQIKEAKDLHKKGKCPHVIVEYEDGYMYDFISCATCGKGLGLV